MAVPAIKMPASGAVLSDGEVVRRVLEGDRSLFELLMRRYDQRAYRAARSILRDDAEAEDAMQEGWMQAWRRLRQLEDGESFAGWLVRITVNEALARLRHRRPLHDADGDDELAEVAGREDPESDAAARELAQVVEAAVDALPLAQRTAFVLREVDGLSTEETAAALGITAGAVKLRLHRARVAIRGALGDGTEAAPLAFRFEAPRCNRMVAAVLARIAAEP